MIQGAAGAGELAQYTYGCFRLAIHGSDKDGCILRRCSLLHAFLIQYGGGSAPW